MATLDTAKLFGFCVAILCLATTAILRQHNDKYAGYHKKDGAVEAKGGIELQLISLIEEINEVFNTHQPVGYGGEGGCYKQ